MEIQSSNTFSFHWQKIARNPTSQVTCPKCKAVCLLPINGPEVLSTNGYVLNNIQMKNLMTKNQKYL